MYSQNQEHLNTWRQARPQSESDSSAENNEQPQVLVVGYSPTGGGHTVRTLNIVAEAVDQPSLVGGICVPGGRVIATH